MEEFSPGSLRGGGRGNEADLQHKKFPSIETNLAYIT